ncbi:hypothetical protein [uncultured Victivallis sp.]|uniref:SIMPL domain-containing protein n=1 Tax=uncultured Victivallis sp. TaxID=354118 RepID=UPI0025DD6771|nr:hypothetical protein [uncultured Victivallis sp.]
MKYILTLFCGLLLLFSLSAEENGEEKFPTISAEAEVETFVRADTCHVLFLLKGTGRDMQSARSDFETRKKAFTEKISRGFPGVSCDVLSVNYGTSNFSDYRATENPFVPNVTKLLLLTLPPDEELAVRLLDCGREAGLTPFCGSSRDGSFGAIYFGLKNPQPELDRLYPRATRKLFTEAERLAGELGRKVVRMEDLSRFVPRDAAYEVQFKAIKVVLPGKFCSVDKARIRIALHLHANFAVQAQEMPRPSHTPAKPNKTQE